MNDIVGIILAAGEGKRMKSEHSKLSHEVLGKSMIQRSYENLKNAGIDDIVVVVGHKHEELREILGNKVKYAMQTELLGTGHAVIMAKEYLEGKDGKVLIFVGDSPMLTPKTIKSLLNHSVENKEKATILSAIYDNPTGYGRIVRDDNNQVVGIVEQKDASGVQKNIKEINSGDYCFDIKLLLECLSELKNNNSQNEYYLTDVIGIMNQKSQRVGAMIVQDNTEILAANDRMQLADLNEIIKQRNNLYHMQNGVTIIDPNTTYIYDDVEIASDSTIYPCCVIEQGVKIDVPTKIGPFSHLKK